MNCTGYDDRPCDAPPAWKDESGNLYCTLHSYLASISGEMTVPIDLSEHEAARWRREVRQAAQKILDEINAEDGGDYIA